MSEETQAKAPAASDAPQTPQAPSERLQFRFEPWFEPRSEFRPPRRRTARRRSRRARQIFPPQEGVQVLHREDRRDSLPRREAAGAVRSRARQDCAAAADRRLHHASAPPHPRHQAGTQYCAAAICNQALNRRLPAVLYERCCCRFDFVSRFVSRGFVSGHDFSRAGTGTNPVFGALAPARHARSSRGDENLENFPWK